MEDSSGTEAAPNGRGDGPIDGLTLRVPHRSHRWGLTAAALICESRANSLMLTGNLVAATEALKCADAIRRSAMS